MNLLGTGGAVAEVLIVSLAGLILFIQWRYTLAEAIGYAIIASFMVLSFVVQLGFLLRLPWFTYTLEVLLVTAAGAKIIKARATVSRIVKYFLGFFREHPFFAFSISIACSYMLLQAVFIPPASGHWGSLNDILFLQQTRFAGPMSDIHESYGPFGAMNAAVLPYIVLRFQTDVGCGIFGFMAYLSIGAITYTLARRYSWPPTALTVSAVVISMPRLIYHAVSPGAELVPAAVALFCILALFRVLENPNIRDLLLMVAGVFFLIAGGPMCLVLPLIMLGLGCVKLVRRHGVITWWALVRSHRILTLITVIPLVIFSQVWLFVLNLRQTGDWIGIPEWSGFAYNEDGIYGSLANLMRYLMESAGFLTSADWLSQELFGLNPPGILEKAGAILITPLFGQRGAAAPFSVFWTANESLAWFGPLAFLLVFPALGFAMVRGPRRLKTTAIALAVYFYLVTLIPAWRPGNAHFLTMFFVCGGFCIAFLLPPWRFTRFQKKGLQTLAILMIGFALLVNALRPVVALTTKNPIPGHNPVRIFKSQLEDPWSNVWKDSRWGKDRLFEARRLFGDNRVASISKLMPLNSSVGLMVSNSDWCYPFLLANPKVNFVVLNQAETALEERLNSLALDYLIRLSLDPTPKLENPAARKIWVATPQARVQGYLIELQGGDAK